MKKKLIATLLAVVLLLGLIPLTSVGGGVAYAAQVHPRATAIDASKIAFTGQTGMKVTYAQLIPGVPTVEETDFGPNYYNCGKINIYVDEYPDAASLEVNLKEALTMNWGSYSEDDGYNPDVATVTVTAENSWRNDKAGFISALDEDFTSGPTSFYSVAIMLTPPLATEIAATGITFTGQTEMKVTHAQLIPGVPTVEETDFGPNYYNCGKINIYVDEYPDAASLEVNLKEALTMNWGSYSEDDGYNPDVATVTVTAENGWRNDEAGFISALDEDFTSGPTSYYSVAIYEGYCPPLATAIDATGITFTGQTEMKVTYAQLIPGVPTVEETDFGPNYYNCGKINIYVDEYPDAASLEVNLKEALTMNWGSYSEDDGYNPDVATVTVTAENSWRNDKAGFISALDEDFTSGPTSFYSVAIYEGGVQDQGLVLSEGVASRTSDTTAEITFSASAAGSYVWAWADEGTTPEKPTNMESGVMAAGVNKFPVNDLTEGAKTLRIWAADESDNSATLDISIYAYTSAAWPQLTSFAFGGGSWTVNGITLTDGNIQPVVNYEEPEPYTTGDTIRFYAGEVIIHYEGKAAAPQGSQADLTGWTATAAVPAGFSDLSISSLGRTSFLNLREKDFIAVSAKSDGITYTYLYKVAVSCSEFLYNVPSTWKQGESNIKFTYSPAEYQRDYNNWELATKGVEYTWGTTADKEALDFTSGSDSFTLTNGAGNTQTYTVTLDMPWQFSVSKQTGYNLSALSAAGKSLRGNTDLSKNGFTNEIRSGQAVTMSIKPTGDNKNKVIDTVTLTKSKDNETIPAEISGNTFTFTMPNDCVSVTEITFQEDDSELYGISASATRYRDESAAYAMGTVTVTDGETPIGEAHADNEVTVKATPVEHAAYDFQFVGWDTEDVDLTLEQKTASPMTFVMPENEVTLTALFEKKGVELSFSANPANALSSVSLVSMDKDTTESTIMTLFTSHKDIVKKGAKIAVRPTGTSQYVLEGYEVKDQDGNIINYDNGAFDGCQFTVPENATSISVVAKYRAKAFSTITVSSNDTAMGSAAATVDGKPVGAAVTEETTVTVTATAKFRYKFKDWTVAYKDGSEVDFALTSSEENPNVATFTVPTSGKEIVITANFERDETQNSNKCEITSVGLYNDEGKIGTVSKSSLNYTITLPADTDTTDLANMILKLTISEFATVTKENDPDKDWVAGAPCGMALDTQTKFTVTAEDGTTKDYTITIKKATAPNAPTLSNGSATRSSKTAATVKFTSNEAGTYYYKVVNQGATAPTVDTTKNGTAAVKGENTISLTNLTAEARDIYIVVVSTSGGKSAPLKVEIPAYGSDVPDTGAYKISVSTPKGGTITTNRTKADAGDEIIVTVIPDDGYQMVEGSLCYGFADGGAPMDKVITNNRFTMPAGDINITCKWETATTTAKGITAFSINGVAGAVNNTTNTITVTMPRGTDVTKLTPVIATNGVKSLTPGSGVTMDFTNAVTYTATMDDGSTKTYTVTVYVEKGTLADQFWDKLTDFVNQVPWWEYAKHQQSTSSYPKYW